MVDGDGARAVLTAALVEHEGKMRRTQDELHAGYVRVERVRGEMVAALGG